MHEIKFGLQIGNIIIYLTIFHLRGDMGPPHTAEIEIFNMSLEFASLIQIHFSDIN